MTTAWLPLVVFVFVVIFIVVTWNPADFHVGVTTNFDQGQTAFVDGDIGIVRKRSQPPDQLVHIHCHDCSLSVHEPTAQFLIGHWLDFDGVPIHFAYPAIGGD
jgi:hypothetical protein